MRHTHAAANVPRQGLAYLRPSPPPEFTLSGRWQHSAQRHINNAGIHCRCSDELDDLTSVVNGHALWIHNTCNMAVRIPDCVCRPRQGTFVGAFRMMVDLQQVIARLKTVARAFNPSGFVPLYVDKVQFGWVRRDFTERLLTWPDVFQLASDRLTLSAELADVESRSVALLSVVRTLVDEGIITGWRDELYAVAEEFGKPPLLHVERAAVRFFGITTYAAHVNGYTGRGGNRRMWLARRSPAKPIDSGMLDNLVAGGISAGLSVRETLAKEGREEAGIGHDLIARAVASGSVRILRAVPEGVQSEIIFVHHLRLPARYEPRNEDGEVTEFGLYRLDEVAKLISVGSEMTLDASLVAMKFLMTCMGV